MTKSLNTAWSGVVAVAAMAAVGLCEEKPADAGAAGEPKPLVQIAILLDTSGSMQSLIEQAKSRLWKIVNPARPHSCNASSPIV